MPRLALVVPPHRLKFGNVLSFHEKFIALIERIVVHLLGRFLRVLRPLLILDFFDRWLIRDEGLYELWSCDTDTDDVLILTVSA